MGEGFSRVPGSIVYPTLILECGPCPPTRHSPLFTTPTTPDTFICPGLVLGIQAELEPFNSLQVEVEGGEGSDSPQTVPRQQGSSVGRSRATSPKRGQVSGRGPGHSRSTGTMVLGAWHWCWQHPLRELFQVSPRARGTPVLSVQAAVGGTVGHGALRRARRPRLSQARPSLGH